MVDKENTWQLTRRYFVLGGSITINDQNQVSVSGNVTAREEMDQLPVQFDHVAGYFKLGQQTKLTSLVGCPTSVTGNFYCKAPLLTSLQGAPVKVDGVFACSSYHLQSLEHLPMQGSRRYVLLWTPHLPLLRLLDAREVTFGYPVGHGGMEAGIRAANIIRKYLGEGKKVMLNCALELKKAGFVENARW